MNTKIEQIKKDNKWRRRKGLASDPRLDRSTLTSACDDIDYLIEEVERLQELFDDIRGL